MEVTLSFKLYQSFPMGKEPRYPLDRGWVRPGLCKKKWLTKLTPWSSTGQGTYTRALCQKNEGSVEIKQRPIKMGGRTLYRTLSPKRALFQTGIDWWPHLRQVPRRRRINHTYPMWSWGHSLFKISSPGPVFHGTKWQLWRGHKHFIRGVGLING
jgi:hypothetical protein